VKLYREMHAKFHAPVLTEQKAGRAPKTVWMWWWRRKKNWNLPGIEP
jgi:hypothetical protein